MEKTSGISKLDVRFLAVATAIFIVSQLAGLVQAASYTTPGGPYTFTVPTGVTSIRVHAVGGGGNNWDRSVYTRGGDVRATLAVTPGQTLYVYVAGNGGAGSNPGDAGVNGGGEGGYTFACGGGGGASDVRTVAGDLSTRLVVAGGGGANFFQAGGDVGQPGIADAGFGPAQPGTLTNGGTAGSGYSTPATAGTFGQGGKGGAFFSSNAYGGGGGGGWYGGGGGAEYGGGAGGSSYVIPGATQVTITNTPGTPSPAVTITYDDPYPVQLINPVKLGNGSFRFGFTNPPSLTCTVLTSTNLALPVASWTSLGTATEVTAGNYQFTDTGATNGPKRFYRVSKP